MQLTPTRVIARWRKDAVIALREIVQSSPWQVNNVARLGLWCV